MQKVARENMTYLVPTLIVSALFAAIYTLHPAYMDDLWYTDAFRHYQAAGEPHYIIRGLLDTWKEHFYYDNNRLGNIIAPLFLLLPDLMQGLFMGVCVFFCIFFGAMTAECYGRNRGAYTLLVFGFTFFLPWNDRMFVHDFGLNYLLPGALSLMLTWLLLSRRLTKALPAFALAFVTGWIHELYAATLAGMALGLLIFCKDRRENALWAALTGATAAFLYLMLIVPATASRMSLLFANPYHHLTGFRSLSGMLYAAPCLLFLVLTGVYLYRHRRFTTTLKALIFASLSGLLLFRIVMSGARTAWPMALFSTVGAAYCISGLSVDSKALRVLTAAMWTCVLLNIGMALPWTWKMRCENIEIHKALAESDSYVFTELTNPLEAPVWLLNKPNLSVPFWDKNVYERVLPEELEDFAPADAELVDAGLPLYRYKGWYVAGSFPVVDEPYMALISFGDRAKEAVVSVRKFANRHGEFVFVMPVNVRYQLALSPITKMEISPYAIYGEATIQGD